MFGDGRHINLFFNPQLSFLVESHDDLDRDGRVNSIIRR